MQEGLREQCSLAADEIKQITSALDTNKDGEVKNCAKFCPFSEPLTMSAMFVLIWNGQCAHRNRSEMWHMLQVDWMAFVASAAAHQNMLSEAKLRAAFDFIDADKDGRICKGSRKLFEQTAHMLHATTEQSLAVVLTRSFCFAIRSMLTAESTDVVSPRCLQRTCSTC